MVTETGQLETTQYGFEVPKSEHKKTNGIDGEYALAQALKGMDAYQKQLYKTALTDKEYELDKKIGEAQGEMQSLIESLEYEPATKYAGLIKRHGKEKGEVSTLSLKQYRDIFRQEPLHNTLTPDGKHVYFHYVMDTAATELGYDSETLKDKIKWVDEARNDVKSFKVGIQQDEDEKKRVKKSLDVLDKVERSYEFRKPQPIIEIKSEKVTPKVAKEEPIMPVSTSVQTGLAGLGKEQAQVEMFGEVSGKTSKAEPLIEIKPKAEAPLKGQEKLIPEPVKTVVETKIEALMEAPSVKEPEINVDEMIAKYEATLPPTKPDGQKTEIVQIGNISQLKSKKGKAEISVSELKQMVKDNPELGNNPAIKEAIKEAEATEEKGQEKKTEVKPVEKPVSIEKPTGKGKSEKSIKEQRRQLGVTYVTGEELQRLSDIGLTPYRTLGLIAPKRPINETKTERKQREAHERKQKRILKKRLLTPFKNISGMRRQELKKVSRGISQLIRREHLKRYKY